MEWINTNNRFVAFFDIMGFKNLVSTRTHEEVIKLMEVISAFAKIIDNNKFKEYSILKTTIFSDSIIIISSDDSIDSAIHIMLASSLLVEKTIELGIPIKGSISYGMFTANFEKSLFIGQPLIDAFLLQEELFLYSVVMHHTFETYLFNKEYGDQKISESSRWFKHLTPLKNGKVWHYHLNWTYYSINNLDKKKLFKNNIHNFYNTLSGKTRGYVDNTLDIFAKMTENIKQ